MSDAERVRAHCVKRRAERRVIGDGAARVIASWWHSGGTSDTYAFVSTGHIAPDLTIRDFHGGTYADQSDDDRMMLDALEAYIADRREDGRTAQIVGWSALWV
jgi:hypothetical protein